VSTIELVFDYGDQRCCNTVKRSPFTHQLYLPSFFGI